MNDEFDDRPRRRVIPPDTSTSSAIKVILIVLGSIALLSFCIIGTIIGLAAYAAQQARKVVIGSVAQFDADLRASQVASALKLYHDQHGYFPPPSMPTTNGAPGLSWRVAILPQLGQEQLYRQFKIDQPWDHPDNLVLADWTPTAYLPPGRNTGRDTHLRVFVGPGSMFEFGRTARLAGDIRPKSILITDGATRTVTFVEATHAVLWIQPDELPFVRSGPVPPLGRAGQEWVQFGFADGTSRRVPKPIDLKRLEAAITAAGGEPGGLP